MKIIDEDRKLALENYQILKDKIVSGDDSAATKEQLNEALNYFKNSTKRTGYDYVVQKKFYAGFKTLKVKRS